MLKELDAGTAVSGPVAHTAYDRDAAKQNYGGL